MFVVGMEEDAAKKRHMTVAQATTAANDAGVKKLVLVHVSPRYERSEIRVLGKTAQKYHPDVVVGRDGDLYEVKFPEG